VKTTQKQGMTEGETGEHTTFSPTTHIKRTPQRVTHTDHSVTRITTRHDHTQDKINTYLAHIWVPPSHLSHATLNVFVSDGRRLQEKTCVEKGFFEKLKYIQKSILKGVINHVTTKNQNSRRIDIGSLKSVKMVTKSVKMVTNSGFKLIQQSSLIRVSQNSEHNLRRTEFQFFQAHDANINIFVARNRTEFHLPTLLYLPTHIIQFQ
jgi:autotransporter adhesin